MNPNWVIPAWGSNLKHTPCIILNIMRGFLFSAALLALVPFSAQGAGSEAVSTGTGATLTSPSDKVEHLDSVVVSATRAGKATPVTYSMVGEEELRRANPLNSLPMNLALQPSVVSVNEGGTGLSYSKMTVRGSRGSQINVTLNGITLNDAESQEVFWVNLPALSGLISSVQLQRGLGTSAGGTGAFGASINMSTASVGTKPYARAEISVGSYNTLSALVAAGTGLTKSGLYFDAAYTKGLTDGYIRNAFADVQSAFAVLGWMKGGNSLRLTYLMGDQHTGITWNGISLEQYEKNRRYNETGYMHEDAYGNPCYYDNDSDNYTQHHIQLNYTHAFTNGLYWSSTFNYTKGDGYFENYKADDALASHAELGSASVDRGNFIIREAMDNHYFVLNSDLKYTSDKWNLTGGLNLSRYDGDHIGKVIWGDILGADFDYDAFNNAHGRYFNNGLKQEANIYARGEYNPLEWLTTYLDLQYRGVFLNMSGPEDDGVLLDYATAWHFFNPRAGLSFHWNPRSKAYFSAAFGKREPGRSDIKEEILNANAVASTGADKPAVSIRPEKMLDIEIGYNYTAPKWMLSANLYLMEYFDMLLETGKLSDVGYAVKANVPRSWRRGVELAVFWQAAPWLALSANATLSANRIKNYTAYLPVYDADYNFVRNDAYEYQNTAILMSPSLVGMLRLDLKPFAGFAPNSLKTTTLSLNAKYVSKQYLDNTASDERSVPAYFVTNLSLTHEFTLRAGTFGLGAYINNLFDNMYYADGWVAREAYTDGSTSTYLGIYPQAPLNFMFKLSYNF